MTSTREAMQEFARLVNDLFSRAPRRTGVTAPAPIQGAAERPGGAPLRRLALEGRPWTASWWWTATATSGPTPASSSPAGPAGLVRTMDRIGIAQACVFPTLGVAPGRPGAGNEMALAAARAFPGRFLPYGWSTPTARGRERGRAGALLRRRERGASSCTPRWPATPSTAPATARRSPSPDAHRLPLISHGVGTPETLRRVARAHPGPTSSSPTPGPARRRRRRRGGLPRRHRGAERLPGPGQLGGTLRRLRLGGGPGRGRQAALRLGHALDVRQRTRSAACSWRPSRKAEAAHPGGDPGRPAGHPPLSAALKTRRGPSAPAQPAEPGGAETGSRLPPGALPRPPPAPSARPSPCRPWGKTCRAKATPCRARAAAKRRLFSTGTPASSAVCHRNAGGVSGVTCKSAERARRRAREGASPSRLCIEPTWGYCTKEITG